MKKLLLLALLITLPAFAAPPTTLTTSGVQTVTGSKTFAPGKLCFTGSSSGSACLTAPAVAASSAAIINAALGYTPANKAGDTFSGQVKIFTANGITIGGPTQELTSSLNVLGDDAINAVSLTFGNYWDGTPSVANFSASRYEIGSPDLGSYALLINANGSLQSSYGIIFPSADPHIVGAWWDNGGVLTKSAGP